MAVQSNSSIDKSPLVMRESFIISPKDYSFIFYFNEFKLKLKPSQFVRWWNKKTGKGLCRWSCYFTINTQLSVVAKNPNIFTKLAHLLRGKIYFPLNSNFNVSLMGIVLPPVLNGTLNMVTTVHGHLLASACDMIMAVIMRHLSPFNIWLNF